MAERDTAVIVGGAQRIVASVQALGLRPIVVDRTAEASEMLAGIQPALIVVNFSERRVEPRIVREMSDWGCPVVVVGDARAAAAAANGHAPQVKVVTDSASDSVLQAALLEALGLSSVVESQAGRRARYQTDYAPLFDHSAQMRAVRHLIEQVAEPDTTVLIRGESGVGKELVARALHFAARAERPFVKVNCAALPSELLESELFGHEKGAFTGAYRQKLGKFEYANDGTLFLDEIGELPLLLQAKLLQVLQDHEFSRVGGSETIHVRTRVIASTNRDLEAAIEAGQFRADLYYRLNVVEIQVPPLRDRREEIPRLVEHMLERYQRQYGRQASVTPETMRWLMEYSWPGNVRELENVVRRLVVLGPGGKVTKEILGRRQPREPNAPVLPQRESAGSSPRESLGLREIARRAALEAERKAIREVLDELQWNRTEAARVLKVSYKTLLTKMTECGFTSKRRRSSDPTDDR
jgi:two-component system response regulator AtoC